MAKIYFNTLKMIVVKYGEIWFPWRNMVLYSYQCIIVYLVFTSYHHQIMHMFMQFIPLIVTPLIYMQTYHELIRIA